MDPEITRSAGHVYEAPVDPPMNAEWLSTGLLWFRALPPDVVDQVRDRVLYAVGRVGTRRDNLVGASPGQWGFRRRIADTELHGEAVRRELPEIYSLYEAFAFAAASICGRSVMLSPYPESGITIKVYGPGDEHGWHYDTQPVAVVLFLTDKSVLEMIRHGVRGSAESIEFGAGDVAVFQGRRIIHRVPPVLAEADSDGRRVSVVFNYYHPRDTWRPAGLSTTHYEAAKA